MAKAHTEAARTFGGTGGFQSQVNPDFNAAGRLIAFVGWYLNNVRIRAVGRIVSALLVLVLVVAVVGGTVSALHVGEIRSFWHEFDVGTGSVYDLGRRLESGVGADSLLADAAAYAVDPNGTTERALQRRVDDIRALVASIRQTEPSADVEQALRRIQQSAEAVLAAMAEVREIGDAATALRFVGRVAGETDGMTEAQAVIAGQLTQRLAEGGRDVGDALDGMVANLGTEIAVNSILLILLAVFFYWFSTRRLTRPLNALSDVMARLAAGETGVEILYLEKADEVGDIARAFQQNARRIERMAEEQRRQQARAAEDSRQAMLALADSFETQIEGVVGAVAGASAGLGRLSDNLTSCVSTQDTATGNARSASEACSGKALVVATAATELSASVAEISRLATMSMEQSGTATREADQAQTVMQQLTAATARIGDVVSLINKVAEKISLLALNATIEAQHAGAAGRGFAVVAQEVKQLSVETQTLTGDVARQVDAIRAVSDETVTAISRISEVIARINGYSTDVASAVVEQEAATGEIARSIDTVVEEAKSLLGVLNEVVEIGRNTDQASQAVNTAAGDLEGVSRTLSEKVDEFLAQVRGGSEAEAAAG